MRYYEIPRHEIDYLREEYEFLSNFYPNKETPGEEAWVQNLSSMGCLRQGRRNLDGQRMYYDIGYFAPEALFTKALKN